MVNYANTHNMADPAQYEVVRAQMDIDQYIDYRSATSTWRRGIGRATISNSGGQTRGLMRGGDGSTTTWINASHRDRVGEDMIDKTTTTSGHGLAQSGMVHAPV